jgi:hypothetical protein
VRNRGAIRVAANAGPRGRGGETDAVVQVVVVVGCWQFLVCIVCCCNPPQPAALLSTAGVCVRVPFCRELVQHVVL